MRKFMTLNNLSSGKIWELGGLLWNRRGKKSWDRNRICVDIEETQGGRGETCWCRNDDLGKRATHSLHNQDW
jgi:hypothetical protein